MTWDRNNLRCNLYLRSSRSLSWKSFLCGWRLMKYWQLALTAVSLILSMMQWALMRFTSRLRISHFSISTCKALGKAKRLRTLGTPKMLSYSLWPHTLWYAIFYRLKTGTTRISWLITRVISYILTMVSCFLMRQAKVWSLSGHLLSWLRSS